MSSFYQISLSDRTFFSVPTLQFLIRDKKIIKNLMIDVYSSRSKALKYNDYNL